MSEIVVGEPTFVIYDTETTGLYKSRSDYRDPSQPWALQLAFVVTDPSFNVIQEFETLVTPPEGATFSAGAEKVHGISEERVRAEGIPYQEALDIFASACHSIADGGRCAYNIDFDDNITLSMLMRAYPDKTMEECKIMLRGDSQRLCVMETAVNFFRRRDHNGALRRMKLIEAYRAVTGFKMPDAHDALADVRGAMTVLKGILEMTAPAQDLQSVGS